MPLDRRPPTADRVVAAAVTLVSVGYAGALWRAGRAIDVRVPMGSDGPMWFDSARLVALDQPVGMPPMYPRLLSLVSGGLPDVAAGLALNALLVALTLLGAAATGALAATDPWARRVAALAAPLVVLAAADPAAYAWNIHPEPLITAALVACAAAGVAAVRWPGAGTAALLGLACGVALGAKEHGLVVGALSPMVVLAGGRPGLGRRAAGWALGLAPFVLAQALDGALFAKAWVSIQEALGWVAADPERLRMLPDEMPADEQARLRSGQVVPVMVRRIFVASRQWWLVVGLAGLTTLGLLLRRQWALALALLLPLLSLLPAVVVWTDTRHYLVVAPAAATLAVAGLGRLAGGRRPALAALARGSALLVGITAPAASARLSTTLADIATMQRERADDHAALAWLIAHLGPEDRLMLDVDPTVLGKAPFMPLPHGQAVRPGSLPADAYRVTDRGASPGWTRQATHGALHIDRLDR